MKLLVTAYYSNYSDQAGIPVPLPEPVGAGTCKNRQTAVPLLLSGPLPDIGKMCSM